VESVPAAKSTSTRVATPRSNIPPAATKSTEEEQTTVNKTFFFLTYSISGSISLKQLSFLRFKLVFSYCSMILSIDTGTIKKAAALSASIGAIFIARSAYHKHKVTELRLRTTRAQHEESAIVKKGCGTRENVDQDLASGMAWACARAREDESHGNQKKLQNSDVSTTSSESGDSTVFAQDTCDNDNYRQCIIKKLRGRQDTAHIDFFLWYLN
jgi:hypothetical protein